MKRKILSPRRESYPRTPFFQPVARRLGYHNNNNNNNNNNNIIIVILIICIKGFVVPGVNSDWEQARGPNPRNLLAGKSPDEWQACKVNSYKEPC
jgi:hypothetical protein